ncbi:MAG: tetraacyldisaccharide 4'-kinase [Candidatus Omnitrophica bacterium]|nr:tetraacyldisaccharide 4'-kinase [Candidatus Omnitrophota bacterium]
MNMGAEKLLYNLATDRYNGISAGFAKLFLFLLSLIYGLVVRLLIFLRSHRPEYAACKVISVGNITLGGTGKTPLVRYIAAYLYGQGRKVAILSRGYAGRHSGSGYIADEPGMLRADLPEIPVVVNPDRLKAAKAAAAEFKTDTVILDDGFQQWHIKKDIEIVTIDATDPFGNSYLLPRGILREPLSSLKRAHLFVLTKTNLNPDTQDLKDFLLELNPSALVVGAAHEPVGFYKLDEPQNLLPPGYFKDKKVGLFCGIADPDSFGDLISGLGAEIVYSRNFRDHHQYKSGELRVLIAEAGRKGLDGIITTEKDAVKLTGIKPGKTLPGLFVLCIKIRINKKDELKFHDRLLGIYNA